MPFFSSADAADLRLALRFLSHDLSAAGCNQTAAAVSACATRRSRPGSCASER